MRGLSLGGHFNQKKYLYTAVITLVAIIILVVGLRHFRGDKTLQQAAGDGRTAPSNTAIAASDAKSAQDAIDSKDYTTAINNYIEAVNAAAASGNYDQAESLLKDAINKVPDNQVPWIIYDDLVSVTKTKGDKALEISSLKKAIIKAQQSNSGAPSGIVNIYQKMLNQLGAS